MKKTDLYLGGEDIRDEEMMPKDFADIIRSFIKDFLGRGQ